MSENSFKISGPSAIRYLDSEEALLADKLDLIVHHVVVTMVLYGCFLFVVAAIDWWYRFGGLACFDHFQERHESSTFFAQAYYRNYALASSA